MKEDQKNAPAESPRESPDLSILSEFDFGPSWAEKDSGKKSVKRPHDQKSRSKNSGFAGKPDRRGAPGRSQFKSDQSNQSGGRRKAFNKERPNSWNSSQRSNFQPTTDVNIYPQDEMFEALIKRLRSTARTYQLFDIAQLILEKPERYIVVVRNKTKKDEKPSPLYFTAMDYLPFENEDAAINHFLNDHVDSLFDTEEVDMEAPKGNFQMVSRCPITGELLGPPNYHRYQEFLQRHYASRINNMSFDHFASKVELVKEQESIDAWMESMRKGFRYTLKDPREGEPESFESLEAVRSFLLQNRRDEIVSSGESVRFAGRNVARLPDGPIRRSIEMYISQQLRFPLDTANNIRGRLRRHHFTVYKKGSRGIAYVCSVKRKFRDSKTVFTSSLEGMIDFIEKNPNILASELPQKYLGIDVKRKSPGKLEMAEVEIAAEESNTDGGSSREVASEEDSKTLEVAKSSSKEALERTNLKPQAELSEDKLRRLNQMLSDLRWLVAEGYVTEYGDGALFAPPRMPDPKLKSTPEEHAASLE